ncbi:hypothetical protein [Amycolatopsis regifaucium]|uniref:Small secreted protein n=1 Tax=Amycolatopsis regifaucium TaxID=546365 RepID=A0A154MGN2_9PSEU|nr:hypothetical protein [Amycolatopsis regifaucium]KZB83621.1 hypothetical protein AVL48_36090 [Amycolatopsis regifaucium]OKA03862.1 hypothetical protein ATP06_0234165 [Amycolatopsis regifaucium]SFJ65587.1 hypothetical protein SAMN04489731_12911 [Amycolatopsis regifaucium]
MCAAHKTSAGLLGAAGIVMILAACAPDPAPQAAPAPAPVTSSSAVADSAAAVTWMNGFCGAVKDFVDGNNKMPSGGGETIEAIKKSTSAQLGHYATILAKTVDGLSALPAAPVPAGETAKQDFLAKYTAARDKTVKAKADLDASGKNDTAAQGRAVEGLIAAQKDTHGALDPVAAILGASELKTAAATAERCRP